MDDDLNVPRALAAVFNFVRDGNTLLDAGVDSATAARLLEVLRRWDGVLGVLGDGEAELPEEVAALVREREEARGRKDYARSDRLREILASSGFSVEDTPGGPRVKRLAAR